MKRHRSIALIWKGERVYISGSPLRPCVAIHSNTRAARHHGQHARRLIEAICETRLDIARALAHRWSK